MLWSFPMALRCVIPGRLLQLSCWAMAKLVSAPCPGHPFRCRDARIRAVLQIGAIGDDGTRGFAVTCMNSAKVLLLAGEKRGAYQISALDVPSGKPGVTPAERGIAVADVRGAGKDDIIVTNGSAGTITLLLAR